MQTYYTVQCAREYAKEFNSVNGGILYIENNLNVSYEKAKDLFDNYEEMPIDNTLQEYRKTLVRYGWIEEDYSYDDNTGSYRDTLYSLNDKQYLVKMKNGIVLSIN